MFTRRRFLKAAAVVGAGFAVPWSFLHRPSATRAVSSGPPVALDPKSIAKYRAPLVIPPAMPRTSRIKNVGGKQTDYYEIAVRQFRQQILPAGSPETTVWGYGSANHPGTFNYPSFTVEAKWEAPVRVKWINELLDPVTGEYLPHLLPVDQTLHWANPSGGESLRDGHGDRQEPYAGPVPIVTHVHGAHAPDWADGYAEAWYLPAATNIPEGYATVGSWHEIFRAKSGLTWDPGSATFEYPNDQRAATLWYHDHSLGMTRANVYAGPAGFFLLRGGPGDAVLDSRRGGPAVLPGPAPALGDPPGMTYFEIPIAIQDRSFNEDGSLFYPDNRAFFEALNPFDPADPQPPYLDIPFHPDAACEGETSDVAPIWQPEFFGNTIVVNGRTWPYLDVQQRRYRFRLLNGCNARFLLLAFDHPSVEAWWIGTEGGFLPAPIDVRGHHGGRILLGPAERADIIVDFGGVPAETAVRLLNLGPDEPFGGGEPGEAFERADRATTGQVMEFRVLRTSGRDRTTHPRFLQFPAVPPTVVSDVTRPLSLNEEVSKTVRVVTDDQRNVVLACGDPTAEPFGPVAALLGTFDPATGTACPMTWMEATSDNPHLGATETWEFHNFTADAHPIHIHEVQFRVIDRQALATDDEGMAVQPASLDGEPRPPEMWETGFKDTVIAYPGEVTRVQATFDLPGRYVWHCHILEHEDNEMMRPYDVVE